MRVEKAAGIAKIFVQVETCFRIKNVFSIKQVMKNINLLCNMFLLPYSCLLYTSPVVFDEDRLRERGSLPATVFYQG